MVLFPKWLSGSRNANFWFNVHIYVDSRDIYEEIFRSRKNVSGLRGFRIIEFQINVAWLLCINIDTIMLEDWFVACFRRQWCGPRVNFRLHHLSPDGHALLGLKNITISSWGPWSLCGLTRPVASNTIVYRGVGKWYFYKKNIFRCKFIWRQKDFRASLKYFEKLCNIQDPKTPDANDQCAYEWLQFIRHCICIQVPLV